MSRRWTLAVACAATAMLMLDIAVVNTALDPIADDLQASTGGLKWIVDAYTVVLAAAVLTAGSLADRFGRRRLLEAGLALFTLASVGCAAAGSIAVLDGARAVQGLGAAVMFAVSLAVIADAFPGVEQRRNALAVYGATIGASFAVGPLVGGALASGLGWRFIFLVNVPLGLACLAANRRWVRESRDPAAPPVDVAGQVLLGAGLLLLVVGLLRGNDDGWTSAGIVAALAGGGACLAAFAAVEARAAHPMLELGLFRRPAFTAAQVIAFGISASAFAGYLYMTLYLQQVVGLSPIATGLTYVPATLVSFFVAGATASLGRRIAPRVLLVTGLLLAGIGLAVIAASTGADSGRWAILPGLLVAMAGVGLINPVLSDLALGSVEDAQSGLAAGTLDTFRQAGIAIGVAGLGALIPEGRSAAAFVDGFHTALLVAAGVVVASAVVTAALLGGRRAAVVAVAVGAVAVAAPAAEAAPHVPHFRARHITFYTHTAGTDLPPVLIVPRRLPPVRLTAQRTVDRVDHTEPECDSEGGCPDLPPPARSASTPTSGTSSGWASNTRVPCGRPAARRTRWSRSTSSASSSTAASARCGGCAAAARSR